MKEFVVYTGLRLVMLAATFGIVLGVWVLVAGHANLLVVLLIAFGVSGLGSYFLLNGQREALARRVDERAHRAAAAFDQIKAKEDAEAAEAAERD